MKIEVTDQFDGSREPFTIRYDKVSATLFLDVFEGFSKRIGIIRYAVPHCAEVGYRHRIVRNNDRLHLLYGTRQVGVVMRILRLR